jgi:SAM-dependent methyltransferase
MDDIQRKALERATYNRTVETDRPTYGSFWDTTLYDAMLDQEMHRDLERLYEQQLPGRKVLILGAGCGEVSTVLRFTRDVWALNIAEKAVREISAAYPDVRALVGDAETPQNLGQRFDVVYCKSILHHLHPIEGVLANVAQILNPGGVLFVASEPGLYNPFAAFGRRFTPSRSHTPGERAFVFSRFRQIATRHFDVLYEDQYFLLSMLLPLLAKRAPWTRAVCAGLLGPSVRLERMLHRLPRVADLYWMMLGVYRVRHATRPG